MMDYKKISSKDCFSPIYFAFYTYFKRIQSVIFQKIIEINELFLCSQFNLPIIFDRNIILPYNR